MSETFPSDPAAPHSQGADVLAAIRRLLAQDAREDAAGAREGELRRRLVGTRRPDHAPPVAPAAPPPLRLDDAQRVALPGVAEAPLATGDRLRELLTFSAWIAEDAATPATAEGTPGGTESGTHIDRADAVACVPNEETEAAAVSAPDDTPLRAAIREALAEELSGEAARQLSAAIHALTRRAVADALSDLARAIAMPSPAEEASLGSQVDERAPFRQDGVPL